MYCVLVELKNYIQDARYVHKNFKIIVYIYIGIILCPSQNNGISGAAKNVSF